MNQELLSRQPGTPRRRSGLPKAKMCPELVTEAENLEALVNKLRALIPELLEANGVATDDEFPFSLVARDRAHRYPA